MRIVNRIVLALVSILLLVQLVHAAPAGDLTTQGSARFVSRTGNDLTIGNQGSASTCKIVQGSNTNLTCDGATRSCTIYDIILSNKLTFSTAASKIVPGATSLSLRNNADSADNLICLDAGSCTMRAGLTNTTGDHTLTNGNTVYTAAGTQDVFPVAGVITPSTASITPAAGYTLTGRYSIVVAGAPTANFVVLPVATTVVGKSFRLYNQSSNPVAIVPQTGSINVSAALTPFACTTLKECECTGITNGNFGCSQK